ncbi:MAG: helix-turn-helix domain-containing protein [Paraburkholderia sp.]|uniref:GlxA family transcriptional regulator n=1 Tax=Paraburkholderia sp. TaxID=1926495 RepID=UPI00122808EC|nr:helix-turn-helix domain-containing protein [Paraburkholderia sp.]TAL99789.1 MAG: helix-turn-helix domain-containing protein [Paraburkholderia sp.]TAM30955.1 MAG: helix-turn-helix domain-containing protein [Paraburkholderia sp.]
MNSAPYAAAPQEGRLRPSASTSRFNVVLLGWRQAKPLDFYLISHVLDMGRLISKTDQIHLHDAGGGNPAPGVRCDALVLCEMPPSDTDSALHTLRQWIEVASRVMLIGEAVKWFSGTAWARGLRVALHWNDSPPLSAGLEHVIVSPSIIEHCGKWTTCCGGASTLDLGLQLVRDILGTKAASELLGVLTKDRIREPHERQRADTRFHFGEAAPKLCEAIALMEANIEEPLQTEEIAQLLDMSRRQLERLFRQHLDTVPSRYYLDLRLQRAQQMLRQTDHSILQIGLMCGFSSAAHFSTTYRTVFGIAPREERQQILKSLGINV